MGLIYISITAKIPSTPLEPSTSLSNPKQLLMYFLSLWFPYSFVQMESYILFRIWLFTQYLIIWDSSMLLWIAIVYSISLLSSVPYYQCTPIGLFIHLGSFLFWDFTLQLKLLWILMYKFLYGYTFLKMARCKLDF